MEFFKKRKPDEEPLAARPATPVIQSSPIIKPEPEPLVLETRKPALPDSEQLRQARMHAEEQIRLIEQKIISQREEWAQKTKEKEEESVSIAAQLEMLVSEAEREREKRQQRLDALQQQVHQDLDRAGKQLQDEINAWNDRLSSREKELEEAKHIFVFEETQKKIETEQALRSLQTELDQVEARYKTMERRLLEEQNQWIAKIKGKEEEISNLRTQISLRTAQMRLEDEKAQAAKNEMETAWQEQEQEIKGKLESQQQQWSKLYQQKEEELIALRSAMERRMSAAGLETEKREKEISGMRARIEERIAAMDASIARERESWQAMLKKREEEFNQLKVQFMLQESQEKADSEKKYQEFKDAEALANRRLREIRQKMEEEKSQWNRAISQKDEDLKVFKIQAELKVRQLQDSWEKRKAGAEQEKAGLLKELSDLETMFKQEKARWQKDMETKNGEIIAFQKERQENQAKLLASEQQVLAELHLKKQELEKELSEIELAFNREKTRWQEIIAGKEKEVAAARIELAGRESAINRDIAAVEMQLKTEMAPAIKQIEDLKIRIRELQRHTADELSRKESQRKTIEEQYKRQEESIQQRMAGLREKTGLTQAQMQQKITAMQAQMDAQDAASKDTISKLQVEEEAIRAELLQEKEKAAGLKAALLEEYGARQRSQREQIEALEKERGDMEEKFNAESAAKTRELEDEQKRLAGLEEKGKQDLAALEAELAELKNSGEKELSEYSLQLENARNQYEKAAAAKQDEIFSLRQALKDNELRLHEELDALKAELEAEINPLVMKQEETQEQLDALKIKVRDTLSSCDARIAALKQEQLQKESDFAGARDMLSGRRAQAKDELHRNLVSLQEERRMRESEFERAIAAKQQECGGLEEEIASRQQSYSEKKRQERERAQDEIEKINSGIRLLEESRAQLEREYPRELALRTDEIAALEKQIRSREDFYARQQSLAEKGLENFQRRAERRLGQIRFSLAQVEEKRQAALLALQDKMSALSADMERREKERREEFEREARVFAEEKYRLERQKAELEESFNALQSQSREQLRQSSQEIMALQSELAEKEKTWEQGWKQKEQELAAEKAVLSQELETLGARLNEEEALAKQRIGEKEGEITHFQNQYTVRLNDMIADITSKKHSWEEANSRLKEQVDELIKNSEELHKTWDATRDTRDKELTALKSNLEFWELRVKAEEDKRLTEWDEEKHALETRIKETADALALEQKTLSAAIEEKERALARLHDESRQDEDRKQSQWKETESLLLAERERLAADVAGREKEAREESAKIEKEKKDLDHEIERLKLESALKETERQSQRHRAERDRRRMQRKLEEQLSSLQRRLSEEKEQWATKLHSRDEEIKTLQVRLVMREERRQAEIKRRHEEIDKALASLSGDLSAIAGKREKIEPAAREEIERRAAELEKIRTELEAKEKQWREKHVAKQAALEVMSAGLTKELADMEEQLEAESRRLAQRFEIKQKQIENLNATMIEKENELILERECTQDFIIQLRQKTDELKRQVKRNMAAPESGRDDKTAAIFDEAIALYQKTDYAAALEKLALVVQRQPRFAGALQYMALCHLHRGDAENARRLAERAFEIEPHNEQLKEWIESLK